MEVLHALERRASAYVHTPAERCAHVGTEELGIAPLVEVRYNPLGQQDRHVHLAIAQRFGHCTGAARELCPLHFDARLLEASGRGGGVPRGVEVLGHTAHADRVQLLPRHAKHTTRGGGSTSEHSARKESHLKGPSSCNYIPGVYGDSHPHLVARMGRLVLALLAAVLATEASVLLATEASGFSETEPRPFFSRGTSRHRRNHRRSLSDHRRSLSEAVSSEGEVPSVRFLPHLDMEQDSEPDEGARIMDGTILPVFPIQDVLFMPYNTPNLTMIHKRHRKMYEEISFTGARQFAVVYQQSDGRMLDVACVFYLTDVLTNANRTLYVGEHTITGRVLLKRILNPSDYVPPELDQEAQFGQVGFRQATEPTPVTSEAEEAVQAKKNYLIAQAEALVDIDPVDEEAEAAAATELSALLLAIAETQEQLGDVPRLEFVSPKKPKEAEHAKREKLAGLSFGRGTGAVWGVENSSWTFDDMGLWGAIGLWQRFLNSRVEAMALANNKAISALCDTYYSIYPDLQKPDTLLGFQEELGALMLEDLPQVLQQQILELRIRFEENAREQSLDPSGAQMQLMLQCQSHRQRLALFKEMLQNEQQRLAVRVSLASITGGECPPEGDDTSHKSPEEKQRRRLSPTGDGARADAHRDERWHRDEQLSITSAYARRDHPLRWMLLIHEDERAEWMREARWRLGCWLHQSLPASMTEETLGACVGALALHVGSRLDSAFTAAQRLLGRSVPTARASLQAAEQGCEWLERTEGLQRLPELPEFPQDARFTIPPIPKLLPTWAELQSSRLQPPSHSESELHGRWPQQEHDATATVRIHSLAVGAGMGIMVASAITCALVATRAATRAAVKGTIGFRVSHS